MSERSAFTRRTRHEPPEDDAWLITFADMSVLLMSFFILMFALSNEGQKRLDDVAKSLRQEGFYNDNIPHTDPFDEAKQQLSLMVAQKGYDAFIAPADTPKGFDVELASGSFFETGSAKFTPSALPMLRQIAQLLAPLSTQDVTVEVVGHTDDSPIAGNAYPTNWELSAARAANVVRYLVAQKFPAEKLRVIGRGDTHPKVPNRDPQGNPIPANQDLNRRVVIRLIRGEDY